MKTIVEINNFLCDLYCVDDASFLKEANDIFLYQDSFKKDVLKVIQYWKMRFFPYARNAFTSGVSIHKFLNS